MFQATKDVFWALVEAGRTGMGMFIESYFLFAIGNVTAIFQVQFPTCFDSGSPAANYTPPTNQTCDDQLITSMTYVEVSCVIVGMLFFGMLGNSFGRRLGSRLTATAMLVGGFFILFSSGPTIDIYLIVFNVGLGILSFGVGGEYPLAASSSAEESEHQNQSESRGRSVLLTFALQGWGNFANTALLLIIVAAMGTGACVPGISTPYTDPAQCSSDSLTQAVKISYAVGVACVLGVVIFRLVALKESEVWEERQEELKHMDSAIVKGEKAMARKLLFCEPMYVLRLVACSGCWFLWDVVFYGNKLFQSTIIAVTIGGQPDLYTIFSYTLINCAVAVAGYYVCALTIDLNWMGRTRIQAMGFLVTSVLFLVCGYAYDYLVQPANIAAFQAIYFLSTFWGQWGPNGTTFLLPSELFPTDVRTETHGIAASWGKLGALTSTLVFSYANNGQKLSTESIFIVNGYASLAGLVLTLLLIPNTGSVSLAEVDRLWETQLLGKQYEGVALEPHNLSFIEVILIYGRKAAFSYGGASQRRFKSHLSQQEDAEASQKLLEEGEEDKPSAGSENGKQQLVLS